MERIPFVKMQAVGNDFVLVDGRQVNWRDWPELSRRMCDRRFGIGSDGLLLVEPGKVEPVRMRMWNPDGTEDFCGNGLRCAAKYAYERELVDSTAFGMETRSGVVSVALTVAGRVDENQHDVESITLDLGEPVTDPAGVPVQDVDGPVFDFPLKVAGREYRLTSLSTGTTHTVIFVDRTPDDDEFFAASKAIEEHPIFPERTSVLWVTRVSPSRLSMRIWERGVGETFGCGTGAAAAGVAAKMHQLTEDCVEVQSKGGVVRVNWRPGETVRLTGDAYFVFEGRFFLTSTLPGIHLP